MREFNYELKQLCQRNRDGSYSTRANRERILELIANQLLEFGLRRKESIMMQPAWADRGDRVALMGRWTKGKREREIPIRTAEQRLALDKAKQLAGTGSLIPKGMRYVEQLKRFETQCEKAGI